MLPVRRWREIYTGYMSSGTQRLPVVLGTYRFLRLSLWGTYRFPVVRTLPVRCPRDTYRSPVVIEAICRVRLSGTYRLPVVGDVPTGCYPFVVARRFFFFTGYYPLVVGDTPVTRCQRHTTVTTRCKGHYYCTGYPFVVRNISIARCRRTKYRLTRSGTYRLQIGGDSRYPFVVGTCSDCYPLSETYIPVT